MKLTEQHIYTRQISLNEVGMDGQKKLQEAHVVIVGIGGLGCPAALYLAASGVGAITLIDGDSIEASNLHRQILFGIQDLGKSKVDIAKSKLLAMHPHLTIKSVPSAINAENIVELFKSADLILDCTDNFAARYLINDACLHLRLPFVSAAIYKFESQVALFNHNNGPTYRCLYPEFPNEKNHPNCATSGVLGVLPGVMGTIQATEALKFILGMPDLLDSQMLCYDARTFDTRKMKLPSRNEKLCQEILQRPIQSQTQHCAIKTIDWDAINTREFPQIVDIREPHEIPSGPESTTHQIPWSKFEQEIKQLDAELDTAVYCQSGIRSEKAVQVLQKAGFNAVSIKGGIQTLIIKEQTI